MTNVNLDVEIVEKTSHAFENVVKNNKLKDTMGRDVIFSTVVKNISYYSLLKIIQTGVLYTNFDSVEDTAVTDFNSALLMRLKQKSNNAKNSIESLKLILSDLFFIDGDDDAVYGEYDELLNILIHDFKNVKSLMPIYKKVNAVIILNYQQLQELKKVIGYEEISVFVSKVLAKDE